MACKYLNHSDRIQAFAMDMPSATTDQSRTHLARIALLLVALIVQFELVEVSLRGYFTPDSLAQSVWSPIAGKQLYFANFLVSFPAILLLVVWPRLRLHGANFLAAARDHSWLAPAAMQILLFILFYSLTMNLSVRPEVFGGYMPLALAGWFACMLGAGFFALLALAPRSYWWETLKLEKLSILAALLIAPLTSYIADTLSHALPVLAAGALYGSEFLLSQFYDVIVYKPSERILGTENFSVMVTNDCAGYEGIALITVFASAYLWLFRQDFKFPRALLVIPLGIMIIWAFNILRIVALIAIGDGISPVLALAGFHSNAGWISFILVSLLILGLLHRISFFVVADARVKSKALKKAPPAVAGVADALLLPLLVLLAAALLLGTLTVEFDWAYPLKFLSVAIVLAYFWGRYGFQVRNLDVVSILIGIAVFAVWMLLVEPDPVRSAELAASIDHLPPAMAIGWLLFRFLGSCLTVPIAEELAFRGYALARLGGDAPSVRGSLRFNLAAFLGSSVLFGLMHSDWLAGTLAGMAYAWARYRRDSTGDAIVAHIITNFLLSCYVLYSGEWSYW